MSRFDEDPNEEVSLSGADFAQMKAEMKALEKQVADLKESVTFFVKVMDVGKKNKVLEFDAGFAAKIETARELAK
jgi:hypothetical protein